MGVCVLYIMVACLVLLSHHISGNSNGSEPLCIVSIKVPRNSLVSATVNTRLNINCTVTKVECQKIPNITWCKLLGNDCKDLNQSNYTETMWKESTQHDGISFLTFLNISMEDTGSYRCKNQNSVSHTINVSVTTEADLSNESNTSKGEDNSFREDDPQWLPYVYICGGVVGLVIIVITVSIVIIRCQGKKSKRHEMTTKFQYTEEQRSDPITLSHPRHNTHPTSAQLTSAVSSAANDTPPVRAGSHRNRPSAGRVPANTTELKGSRNNVRTAEDEDNLLVYASLNHQAVSRGPRRTVQQETEPSEYAAIRFR